jgi:hypothetical protein
MKVQPMEQQDPVFPLLAPASHCSFIATIPSPQTPVHKLSGPQHCPDVQLLVEVQVLLSSQVVPSGFQASGGHWLLIPLQISATSQVD